MESLLSSWVAWCTNTCRCLLAFTVSICFSAGPQHTTSRLQDHGCHRLESGLFRYREHETCPIPSMLILAWHAGCQTRQLVACLGTHRLRGLCCRTGPAPCCATGTRRRSGDSMTTSARTTTCPPSWSAPCAMILHAPMRAAPPAGTASAGSAWTSGSRSRSGTASAAHAPTADVSAGAPPPPVGPPAAGLQYLAAVLQQQSDAAWLWCRTCVLVACWYAGHSPACRCAHPCSCHFAPPVVMCKRHA